MKNCGEKKVRRGQTPAVFSPQSLLSNLIKPLLHGLLNVGLFSFNTNQRGEEWKGQRGRRGKFSISVMTAEVETVSKQDPFKCVSESQGQHFDILSARKPAGLYCKNLSALEHKFLHFWRHQVWKITTSRLDVARLGLISYVTSRANYHSLSDVTSFDEAMAA